MLRDHFYICPSSILYNVGSLLSLKKAMVSCSLYMVGFCFPPCYKTVIHFLVLAEP